MQRDADAVDQFEKSVSIEPNTGAYSNLGVAHYRLKHYTEAALAYQRAVDMVRTNSAYWGNLADAYRWAPELHDKAPEAYRRAIELLEGEVRTNSRDARLRARLAMYYASVYALGGSQRQPGDRRRALEEMANSLMLDSSSAYVQFRAALVYEQVGDRERALKALQLALDAGEPRAEVLTSPPLEALRKDPRFARMASPRP
jgi:serine/threonine-protein kinase